MTNFKFLANFRFLTLPSLCHSGDSDSDKSRIPPVEIRIGDQLVEALFHDLKVTASRGNLAQPYFFSCFKCSFKDFF